MGGWCRAAYYTPVSSVWFCQAWNQTFCWVLISVSRQKVSLRKSCTVGIIRHHPINIQKDPKTVDCPNCREKILEIWFKIPSGFAPKFSNTWNPNLWTVNTGCECMVTWQNQKPKCLGHWQVFTWRSETCTLLLQSWKCVFPPKAKHTSVLYAFNIAYGEEVLAISTIFCRIFWWVGSIRHLEIILPYFYGVWWAVVTGIEVDRHWWFACGSTWGIERGYYMLFEVRSTGLCW